MSEKARTALQAHFLFPELNGGTDPYNNDTGTVTLSPPIKLSSAKFLVCFNFQSALMPLKLGENVVRVSNSLDPDEMPR